MFAPANLSDDGFLGGRLRIAQPRHGYRAAADPVLLAAAVPARRGETVLELGCGAGVASLCLGARVDGLGLTGLELQPDYAALARSNAIANEIAFDVVEGDLGRMPAVLRGRSFDHVIANPPYFPRGGGTAADDRGRELALREETPLSVWLAAGVRRLRPGGRLTLIQAAERLPDLLAGLGPPMGSAVLLPIAPRIGRDAGRVILQATKGGRAAFRLATPLVLHEGARHLTDGDDYTAQIRAVLRDAAALEF
ncbi:tRNA1(Val) (adenine(37)-N6)-methyltransferase [Defluviimonas aquaemixtae]|uniref:tRNA1(Val) (Adenine(37)-N6)-methyltransferase n=1 Tax=Albidovulum aquaemixtae TaxID=1542388 RepID=A0A2R8BJ21_9RHOB|nr:methyltransferase [Defluviimonas aquaemixtae]SPH23373.1 tRNA1(Val) (adenine(37)-N6)-methyltransferase [Defluviimonas aquaemixtae]